MPKGETLRPFPSKPNPCEAIAPRSDTANTIFARFTTVLLTRFMLFTPVPKMYDFFDLASIIYHYIWYAQ